MKIKRHLFDLNENGNREFDFFSINYHAMYRI